MLKPAPSRQLGRRAPSRSYSSQRKFISIDRTAIKEFVCPDLTCQVQALAPEQQIDLTTSYHTKLQLLTQIQDRRVCLDKIRDMRDTLSQQAPDSDIVLLSGTLGGTCAVLASGIHGVYGLSVAAVIISPWMYMMARKAQLDARDKRLRIACMLIRNELESS